MSPELKAAAIYTALNALWLLVLSYNVGRHRDRANALNPGDPGDAVLVRAIRAHANAAEYMPLAVVILVLLALLDAPLSLIHTLGAGFTAGRIIHSFGMFRDRHPNPVRFTGNLLTGLVYLVGPLACVYYGLN